MHSWNPMKTNAGLTALEPRNNGRQQGSNGQPRIANETFGALGRQRKSPRHTMNKNIASLLFNSNSQLTQ